MQVHFVESTIPSTYIQVHIYKCTTGRRRPIGCLIFVGHFPQKSHKSSGSFAKMTCNLRYPMGLRHPVGIVDSTKWIPSTHIYKSIYTSWSTYCDTLQHSTTHCNTLHTLIYTRVLGIVDSTKWTCIWVIAHMLKTRVPLFLVRMNKLIESPYIPLCLVHICYGNIYEQVDRKCIYVSITYMY